jgi:proteic killer suppression protein
VAGSQTVDNSGVSRNDTHYATLMIKSFRHKGLEDLYQHGSVKGVLPAHKAKLVRILGVLDLARSTADLTIPGFRTHELKGERLQTWSIWVNGNWRVTFRFIEQDVELVDYLDYH